jgi:hypothetical protein
MSTEQAPGVQDKDDLGSPSARIVNKFHNRSDIDSSPTAQHHTLGLKRDQAASGAHRHDGRDSQLILAGVSITGSRSGGGALDSVLAILEQLGAVDNTTA